MPTVSINDVRLYYEILGEGEPLTLILGLGTDISEWGDVIRWLAERYRVIAFDNRGAGRSDKPDVPYGRTRALSGGGGGIPGRMMRRSTAPRGACHH
jgi:pimeloyl-ACP methyl ester carboxylesterase